MSRESMTSSTRKCAEASLAVLLSALLAGAGVPAFAMEGAARDAQSTLDVQNVANAEDAESVGYEGGMLLAAASDETFVDEQSGLVYQVLGDGTVQVGTGSASESALVDASTLSVTVPSSVTHDGEAYEVVAIGAYAFYNTDVVSVSLPKGLLTIGDRAFKFCRSLESIVIPDSVQTIGAYAFFCNNALASVTFGEESALTTIGKGAFAFGSTDADKNTTDGDNTASLVSISLPAGLTEIPKYLFNESSALKSCTINSPSLTRIDSYAFSECSSLESIDIPVLTDTEHYILGQKCFLDCSSLKTVIFRGDADASSVTITPGTEFASCTSVEKVVCYGKGLFEVAYSGNHGLLTFSDDVQRYFTVYFYENEEDAAQQTNRVGYVTVLEGTTKAEICSGAVDSENIFDSENYDAIVGEGWTFENGLRADGELDDTYYAVACDKDDLANADIVLGGSVVYSEDEDEAAYSYCYRGDPIDFGITVVDAAGGTVAASNYTLEVTNEDGSVVDLSDIAEAGTYSVVAKGVGAYSGTQTAAMSFAVKYVDTQWNRLSGLTLYGGMKAIVDAAFESYDYSSDAQGDEDNVRCEYAIVASGDDTASAVLASSLAGALNAPVLLTDGASLSSQTSYEISRIGARKIVIIGSTAAVSNDVQTQLGSVLGVTNVYRIQADDQNELARKICTVGGGTTLKASWSDTCLIVSGADPTDALSLSPYAYATSSPIFLCDYGSGLDDETLSLIRSNFPHVIIAGNEKLVSSTVDQQLSGLDVVRIAGANHYETSLAIADYFLSTGDYAMDGVVLASAEGYPEAVAASALAGSAQAPLILCDTANMSDVSEFLTEHRYEVAQGYVAGSEDVFSSSAFGEVELVWGESNNADGAEIVFPDVDAGEWYTDPIAYVASAGLMTGYDNGSFGVGDSMLREQFATVFYRYAGAYASGAANTSGLTDVTADEYYTAPINWAAGLGIIIGYTDGADAGMFGVGDELTFEQMVTIIARYVDEAEAASYDTSNLSAFADAGSVSDYAKSYLAWGYANGVFSGYEDDNTIRPQEYISRERAATVLYKALQSGVL